MQGLRQVTNLTLWRCMRAGGELDGGGNGQFFSADELSMALEPLTQVVAARFFPRAMRMQTLLCIAWRHSDGGAL
jgi:hypothetical protein